MLLGKGPKGEAWVHQIFDAKSAKTGGVLRRKVASVEKYASEQKLVREVKRRGFHALRVEDHYLIICATGRFKLLH